MGDADKVMEAAIEAGAEDVESNAEGHTIYCGFEGHERSFQGSRSRSRRSRNRQVRLEAAEHRSVDEEKAQSLMKLIDNLEDDDDVQNVYSNFEVSDEVMAKLSA